MGEGLGATHYNWRPDIADFVAYIESQWPTAANTYWDHPTGFGRDATSVDFWNPGGRGDPIDFWVGQAIWDYVFFGDFPPYIEWVIWQGWMWTYWDGSVWYCDIDPWDCHFDHVHFTFF